MNIIAGIVRLLRLDPEPVNFKPLIITTLTKTEVANIGKTIEEWANEMLKEQAFPIILIAQKKMDAKEIMILRGGNYSPDQIRALLIAVAQNIDDNA